MCAGGENATASHMRHTPSFLFLAAAVRCYGCGRHVAKMPRPCLVFCGNLKQSRFADFFCFVAAKHRSHTGGHPPSLAPTITAAASQPPAQTYRTCVSRDSVTRLHILRSGAKRTRPLSIFYLQNRGGRKSPLRK